MSNTPHPTWARLAGSIILGSAAAAVAADPPPSTAPASTAEVPVAGHIEAVGLFKNGLAVVRQTVHLPGPGVFRIDAMPAAVHGTFWVESDLTLETRVTNRLVQVPPTADNNGGGVDLQQDLVGRTVTVRYKGSGLPPTVGTVVSVPPPKPTATGGYDAVNPYAYYWNPSAAYNGGPGGPATFLVVQTSAGRTYANLAEIAAVDVDGTATTVARRRPVVLLTVPPTAVAGGDVRIDYVAPGLSWAPAYRLTLGDGGKLTVAQQAAIKNELADLTDADVSLISGVPAVRFATVTTPLAVGRTWDDFFTQLAAAQSGEYGGAAAVLSNSGVQSQATAAGGPGVRGGVDPAAPPPAESADVHYQPIGRRTLAQGDAMVTTVASATADYRRLVQWHLDDPHAVDRATRTRAAPDPPADEQVWEVVRFTNPFPFPMTTGPAVLVQHGRFAAEAVSDFVNSGSPQTVRLTRALSVPTAATTAEDPTARRVEEQVAGGRYERVTMVGELTYANRRPTPVTMEIVRDLWGELLSADGKPEQLPQADSVDVRQRHWTLRWTVDLKPGEQGKIAYRYTTLQD